MIGQHPGRAVVVGVDGSADALRAVRWAVPEARRRRAVLRLVHAFAWTDDRMVGMPGLGREDYGDRLRAAAQRGLSAAAAVASELDRTVPVESELVLGTAAGVLVEQSQSAELAVVGDRGRGRITSMLAGSVAVGVAAHAACPVVVVRGSATAVGGPPTQPPPVVVGVDGTPLSEAALAFAFDAASTRSAPLLAVHTWLEALADPDMAPLVDWRGLTEDETVALGERLAGWGEKYPDVIVERVVVEGRAAQVLRDLSRAAQLVVVGSRGRGEFAGLVLGSVSSALVHGAWCPVAVVRSAEE